MCEDAAANVATKLLLDVVRDVLAAFLSHHREEGLEVLAHDEVQGRVLRTTARVGPWFGRGGA
jgi:hypothetical protein